MPTTPVRRRPATLIGLELFSGIGAVAGGIGLAAGNTLGMPDDWLAGSPWTTWTWPGVFLLLVVAVPMLLAATAQLRRIDGAWRLSLLAGFLQIGWILAEWVVFGRYHWLQPTMLVVGLAVVALAAWSARG
jgi:hypothetical protein